MFGFGMNTESYIFETHIGNALADSQQMHTIPIIAQQQYKSMCAQFGNDPRPIKCVIARQELLDNGNLFWHKIEFINNSYVKEIGGFK